ncbi:MAG: hypothetical protein AB7P52_00160 [Alphaproteobacteria bacterium]
MSGTAAPAISIRNATPDDIPGIRELLRKAYPDIVPYSTGQLRGQLSNYPEGQFVAVLNGKIVGHTATFRLPEALAFGKHTFVEITGLGQASRHDPRGDWLYRMEVCADPDLPGWREDGRLVSIGVLLVDALKALCRKRNLKGITSCSRMPGLGRAWPEVGSAEAYIEQIRSRKRRDPVLAFHMRNGFELVGPVPNYMSYDEESRGYAGRVVWRNPDYWQPKGEPFLPALTPGLPPPSVVHMPRPAARSEVQIAPPLPATSSVAHAPRQAAAARPAEHQPTTPQAKPAPASSKPAPSTQRAAPNSSQETPVLPGDLRSFVEGVAWPAFPNDGDLRPLALQFQLEQSQWWSPERLRKHQFHQLAHLLRHAAAKVPYYRSLFARIGFDAAAPLSEEAWLKLPILDRRTVQTGFEELNAESYPKSHGNALPFDSSGSTGTPIRVLKTELQLLYFRANTLRDHLWHKRDLGARLAAIIDLETLDEAAYPKGETLPRWGRATRSIASGTGHLLNLVTKVHLQAEWLQRVQPAYLMSFPSNLEALARHCRDNGIAYPTLRQLRTLSEPVKPEVRELCREVFGCEIKDTYSSEEVGNIAFESPVSNELLTLAETVLVEIIDEAGRPCAPGEVGRVVVTPLHAFAMPLIRYAVGDLAEAGAAAACGRGLPVIARVLGRERQIVKLPNGQQLYPSYHYLTRGLDKIVQFQIARKSVELLEVRLVTRSRLDDAEEADLRTRVRERFQYPFDVSFAYVDEIPRARSGKFFDYVSEID